MFKALVIWYNNKVASFLPSALDTMKAQLRAAEMEYMDSVEQEEAYKCEAEVRKVIARHNFERCKRLQRFIDSEEESLHKDKEFKQAIGSVLSAVSSVFDELDAAIAKSDAEAQFKETKAKYETPDSPLKMSDEEFQKSAAEKAATNPSGFKAGKDYLTPEEVINAMEQRGLRKKKNDTAQGINPTDDQFHDALKKL